MVMRLYSQIRSFEKWRTSMPFFFKVVYSSSPEISSLFAKTKFAFESSTENPRSRRAFAVYSLFLPLAILAVIVVIVVAIIFIVLSAADSSSSSGSSVSSSGSRSSSSASGRPRPSWNDNDSERIESYLNYHGSGATFNLEYNEAEFTYNNHPGVLYLGNNFRDYIEVQVDTFNKTFTTSGGIEYSYADNRIERISHLEED